MENTATWAGQLRREKKGGREDEKIAYDKSNLRQSKRETKVERIKNTKIVKPTSGTKMATNRLLSASWLALIPSFGLSLIWINVHVFMHALFPSVFGELGQEWVPGQARVEVFSKSTGIVEKMVLFFLDFLAVMVILSVLAVIIALLDALFGILGHIFVWFITAEKKYINPENGIDAASEGVSYIRIIFRV